MQPWLKATIVLTLVLPGCATRVTAPVATPASALVRGTVTVLYGESRIPGSGMVVCVNGDLARGVNTDALGRYQIRVDHPGHALTITAITPPPQPGTVTVGGASGSITLPTAAYVNANILAIYTPI